MRDIGSATDLLPQRTQNELALACGYGPIDAEFTYDRTGKFIISIIVHQGLCQFGKFRFDCKKHTIHCDEKGGSRVIRHDGR